MRHRSGHFSCLLLHLYKVMTAGLTSPPTIHGTEKEKGMGNLEVTSTSLRANYGVPAKLPPWNSLQTVYLCLIMSSQLNLFLLVSLCLSFVSALSVLPLHHPLPVSLTVCSLPHPQGFLKNERDNALLSAIEESRRRVSVCFLH